MSQEGVMVSVTLVWNCIEFEPIAYMLCFATKVTKGNNSIITLDRVMVLVHCTFSSWAWPMKLFWIPTNTFQVMLRTMKNIKGQ
jgi:hypothetical protein